MLCVASQLQVSSTTCFESRGGTPKPVIVKITSKVHVSQVLCRMHSFTLAVSALKEQAARRLRLTSSGGRMCSLA